MTMPTATSTSFVMTNKTTAIRLRTVIIRHDEQDHRDQAQDRHRPGRHGRRDPGRRWWQRRRPANRQRSPRPDHGANSEEQRREETKYDDRQTNSTSEQSTMTKPLMVSHIPDVPLLFRGKVRDVYDLGDRLLIVASDRISAFDVVLPTPIPGKGRILTELSSFWFRRTSRVVPNHLLEVPLREVVRDTDALRELRAGRAPHRDVHGQPEGPWQGIANSQQSTYDS
jgi:hypothetical protein